MKTINIITAILSTVNSFGNDVFSIYNVTRAIREDVNDGSYLLEEYDDFVDHDIVKKYFIELIENNALVGYSERYNQTGYREYIKDDAPVLNTPVVSTLPNVAQISQNSKIPFDVQKKMYQYIKDNGPVTMKQIQSRLKGFSCTCSLLKDFLSKLNLVDPKTLANPDSKVYTVKFP